MKMVRLIGVPATVAALALTGMPQASATGLQVDGYCYQVEDGIGIYYAYKMECDYGYSGGIGTVRATVYTSNNHASHFSQSAAYVGFNVYCPVGGTLVVTLTLRDSTGATASDTDQVNCSDLI